MSAKSAAQLTTDNASVITGQSLPETVTPPTLGGLTQDIIDSFYNKIDILLIKPEVSMTKAALAAAIVGSALTNKQWIQISDAVPILYVQAQGVNNIAPVGYQIISGKTVFVVMDYLNGYDGVTHPFLLKVDENRKLALNGGTPISKIIKKQVNLSWGAVGPDSVFQTTLSETGAIVGDNIQITPDFNVIPATGFLIQAWCDIGDFVIVRLTNIDPAATINMNSALHVMTIIRS